MIMKNTKYPYHITLHLTTKQYKTLKAMSLLKNKPMTAILRELIDQARKHI
jgi:hypothetical protein